MAFQPLPIARPRPVSHSRKSRTKRGFGCALVGVFALSMTLACHSTATGSTELENGLHVPRSTGGTPGVGNQALLEGEVVDRDGCLAIRGPSGRPIIPIFDVKDSRPEKISIGDKVSLQGGFLS